MKRTLQVRTVDDLLAFIPLALGFHPQASVVITTFTTHGDQPHIRVDIDDHDHDDHDTAGKLATILTNRGVTSVALVAYTDQLNRGAQLTNALHDALTDAGITVGCALATDGENRFKLAHRTWVPLRPGGLLDEHPFLLQAAYDGRTVHNDRTHLTGLVACPADAQDQLADALAEASDQLHDTLTTPGNDWAGQQARWIHDTIGDHVVTGDPLADADAARMACLLGYHDLRDVAWGTITEANAGAHLDLWCDLCRRVPDDLSGPAATLAAYAAWLTGNGALAWVAVDKAQQAAPGDPLTQRLAAVLASGVPAHRL